jgi:hypothetical protein
MWLVRQCIQAVAKVRLQDGMAFKRLTRRPREVTTT